MEKTVIIFGSNGMLGMYLTKYLSTRFNVIPLTREDYDVAIDNKEKLSNLLKKHKTNETIVINCIGIIPQRVSVDNKSLYVSINALFPHLLSHICDKLRIQMIHFTTDCVYNNVTGNNSEDSEKNPICLYDVTKHLGEPEDVCVIRTSFIGEEKYNKCSFLEWVRSNKNGVINGYSNQYWNGVTALTLAKIARHIIETNGFWKGVHHIYSNETVSKYDLCVLINEIYDLNITINKIETQHMTNKSLTSKYALPIKIKSLKEQIKEQHVYNL